MSAHTPGPWDVTDLCVFALQQVERRVRGMPELENRFYLGVMGKAPPEELAANARLIAAAPDLLAVANEASREAVLLREMDELVEQRSAVDPCGDGLFGIGAHKDEHALKWQAVREELNALVARRLAAIAKAEGKS